ncbi:MAG: hypothetical protein COY66_01545 [Candidatus Kerfeldbacteria bacterium CG_4_10_14_0_8_um_filter_42_10]|uniref:Uncharacterized protein n=1 Tax=Candidatus Kerfeldbacteria bacterium CG_4_10_14_0_8_um_filter_42_10 TaxID=2014248 RepID=A0A2M7RK00_9BACT|nr:MAG: hypothetical protein COY66_01545 [Candidatus Kerfeldbacteria bacterium CG_4_10_14_0_8_um_filter_42_10]
MVDKNKKTGIPFIIFLVVITVFLSYWFLKQKEEISQESVAANTANLNQRPIIVNNSNSNSDIANTVAPVSSTFQNADYDFEIANTSEDEAKEMPSGNIYTVYFNEDKISVLDETSEGVIRNSVSVVTESAITMAGQTGARLKAESTKDGSEVNLILVKKNGRLYQFQGSDSFLDRMIKDFSFTD